MILKGSQRSGAKQLGLHLLKTEENEHVELHDMVCSLRSIYSRMNSRITWDAGLSCSRQSSRNFSRS